MHWEMRYPKIAITKFWILWVIGWLLIILMFVLKPIAFIIEETCHLAVSWVDFTPWELKKFLLRDIAKMNSKEATCQKD